jgi:hypothetical protein
MLLYDLPHTFPPTLHFFTCTFLPHPALDLPYTFYRALYLTYPILFDLLCTFSPICTLTYSVPFDLLDLPCTF